MTILSKRKERIKRIEEKKREELGVGIVIEEKYNKQDCPDCVLDPFYNETDVDCETCGGEGYVYSYRYHSLSSKVRWGNEIEEDPNESGLIERADCRVEVSIDYKDLIERAVNNENTNFKIAIDDNDFYVIDFYTNTMKTKVLASCERIM